MKQDSQSKTARQLPGSMPSHEFSSTYCRRDRLVSLMLQDRRALRLLSAPSGYGKTVLSSEYACRMFSDDSVVWIDGSSPEFLGALDNPVEWGEFDGAAPGLVIFDNVAFLDEGRVVSFKSLIEDLLNAGVEVVASVLPSNDCLRDSQGDRLLLTANDFLVTERDIRMSAVGMTEKDQAARLEKWRMSGDTFFGFAPCSVWPVVDADKDYLRAFFEERLPLSFLRTALAMIMLKNGSLSSFERMGIAVRHDDVSMMVGNYPFLGVGPLQNEFAVGEQDIEKLLQAVAQSDSGEQLLKGESSVPQACAAYLMHEGNLSHAANIVDTFFSSTQCGRWLESFGWELLDAGELSLLESLIANCGDRALESNPTLQVLQSWSCGLQGDVREAIYYAKRVMNTINRQGKIQELFVPFVLSYLSVLAFSSEELPEYQKPKVQFSPRTPAEHVAVLVCHCSDAELLKGLGVIRGQYALKNPAYSENVETVDQEREELIESLLVSCERYCPNTMSFRLCLHFATCLDSSALKDATREYGCGIIFGLRKRSVKFFSEAMLVADLWRNGFFGAGTRGDDIRDGRLLDESSAMVNRLSRMCGRGSCAMPWESGLPPLEKSVGTKGEKGSKKEKAKKADRLPMAKVTIFGGLEVLIGDRYIPESSWNHRALQLFAILVLHQGRDVSRETLFSLLWPGLPRTRARDNFYTAWSHMQALLGEGPYLVRRGEFCSVSSRYVSSDVAEFNQLARRLLTERENSTIVLDIYARMESLYRGGLLPGENGCKFIEQQREKYRSVYVDSMVAAAHTSLQAKDAHIALWFARRAMDEDAQREDVYYALIRAQVVSGQRCSAIRTYFQCREFLQNELGLDPSTKTVELYEQLLQSDPTLARLGPENFR